MGIPHEIPSDQENNFMSQLLKTSILSFTHLMENQAKIEKNNSSRSDYSHVKQLPCCLPNAYREEIKQKLRKSLAEGE